ncbi:MAG: hypothetical protein SOI26_02775 [Coriobacteriales bacterium]|jgi:predicted nucleic-acid-binding protein
MTIVDETLLLRYLLDDDPVESPAARDVIAKGDAMTYPEILARTVITLRDVYHVPRSVIGAAVTTLLDDVSVDSKPTIVLALRLFGTTELDFTDCLMVARNVSGGGTVATFDKPLMNEVMRAERSGRTVAGDEGAH